MGITGMYPVAGPPSSGGGGSVSPILDWVLVDPTSMTKTTPDAMTISSESMNSGTGVVTFTMGALGTGNAKYNIAGTGAEYPRYSANLVDSDGVQLTTDDSFIMFVRFSLFDDTVPSQADLRIAVGLCLDPTATATVDIDGYGVGLRTRSVSRLGGHFKVDTPSGTFTTYSSTATDTVFGSVQRTSRRLGCVIAFGEDSDGAIRSPSTARTTPATTNAALTAGADYKLLLAVSTASSSGTIDAGQTFALRADYAIKRLR